MNELRMLFWETTNACNLKCAHCRACPVEERSDDELSTDQAIRLLDEIASFAKPVIVLSGGEPFVREDIFDIASYGTSLGLRMVMATNGTLLDSDSANRLVKSGIGRVSISIDGSSAASHDAFRGVSGAYDGALRGIEHLKSAGMPFQVNTTVTRANINHISDILDLAINLGASALHLFLLVPTGCGKEIADTEMISPQDYERVLQWIYETSKSSPIGLRATCAPHYYRVMAQDRGGQRAESGEPFEAMTKGCLAGSAVCFVSFKGDVFPCGYFPVSAGNVLQTPIQKIWDESELFAQLRDPSLLTGKCGHCEFSRVCGGCRARAYAETGDYLGEEPYCVYKA